MVLKSKSVLSGSKQMVRSRSSDNLPTSQSQVNVQMMSHTLTIREVSTGRLTAPLKLFPLSGLSGCRGGGSLSQHFIIRKVFPTLPRLSIV